LSNFDSPPAKLGVYPGGIKKYIEDQSDEPSNFKVWDEQDLSSQGSPLGS
jgi:hypothetical protein